MREITIRLLTAQDKECTCYSIPDNNTVHIELSQESYDQFEQDAKRFGMDILDALGHGVQSLIKGGIKNE